MKGKIIFISGPSGVGKGTLISALRERHPEWIFPPSCTTRSPRPGEKEGETYYFITHEEFQRRIEAGEFLEYAEVHGGNLYGTLKKPLIDGVENGKVVIREFDVQGYTLAQKHLPREYYSSIFLLPDGPVEMLVERIRARAPISDADVEARIESMKKELALAEEYDYRIIVHDNEIERLIEDAERVIATMLQNKN